MMSQGKNSTILATAAALALSLGGAATVGAQEDSGEDRAGYVTILPFYLSADAEFLVAQSIDRSRLVARGYGESRPVADNAAAAGRERNRRVEFNVLN